MLLGIKPISYGGLGLRSLTTHSCAAYIASLCSLGLCAVDSPHLINAVAKFNSQVSTSDLVTIESLTANPVSQRVLSGKLENQMFHSLLGASSIANKARLLAVCSHAASWISVVSSVSLGLHLDPSEFQVAIMWWLGMNTSGGSLCSVCPEVALDSLGHHAVSCKQGGDAVIRHNKLRDVFAEACCCAYFPMRIEMGSGLTPDHNHSRPADVLVEGCMGKRKASGV